ncbi:hypothetical protein PHYBOEH_009250 [Phytophthora boehmeriae]|uniref:Uncharacterized protein n=1 Tax=Phytophthora boehmeriae TaxID=109152 RepID=A0A8T1VYF1_9STRA|nr:hypothetical protein PHYBOEH_009250 [Phytophthora boehmeriae]
MVSKKRSSESLRDARDTSAMKSKKVKHDCGPYYAGETMKATPLAAFCFSPGHVSPISSVARRSSPSSTPLSPDSSILAIWSQGSSSQATTDAPWSPNEGYTTKGYRLSQESTDSTPGLANCPCCLHLACICRDGSIDPETAPEIISTQFLIWI